jgi:hypothetical protein
MFALCMGQYKPPASTQRRPSTSGTRSSARTCEASTDRTASSTPSPRRRRRLRLGRVGGGPALVRRRSRNGRGRPPRTRLILSPPRTCSRPDIASACSSRAAPFPRFDRNPNTGNLLGVDGPEALRPARQTIFHEPTQARMAEAMELVSWSGPQVPLASNARGELLTSGEDVHQRADRADRQPGPLGRVRQALADAGVTTFLELGSGARADGTRAPDPRYGRRCIGRRQPGQARDVPVLAPGAGDKPAQPSPAQPSPAGPAAKGFRLKSDDESVSLGR